MLRRTRFLAMALGFAAAVATPAGAAPNDALQDEQWAFAPSALFDLPAAWNLSQGAGVVVAVVDSGMKLDHPDLAPNVWTNFGEIPGNGVDDDNNGYVDDLHGVDLTTANANNDLHDTSSLLQSRPRGCDDSTAASGVRRPRAELSGPAFVPGDTAQDSWMRH